MQAVFIILGLAITLALVNCSSQKRVSETQAIFDDSVLLLKIKQIDIEKYIGLPVDSFMENEVISTYKHHRFFDEPPGNLSYLSLEFSNKIFIEVFVDEYQFVTQYSSKRDWKLEDYKKERISIISVLNGRQLVKRFGRPIIFSD